MSVAGQCEICTVGQAAHTCNRCASLVCDAHFDERSGLCVECLAEVGGGERRRPGRMPDGVDTYQF
jgi:hypothetical protein